MRTLRKIVFGFALLACCMCGHAANTGRGLSGRVIVGYQGWFGCPGDFEENPYWQHWFLGEIKAVHLTVDLLPDTSGLLDSDLCDTGLPRADGEGTVKLFSSLNPNVVRSHMEALRRAQIDGIALQRFVAGLSDPKKRRRMDQVLRNLLAAAQETGRVLYLTYDVSGAPAANAAALIIDDWQRLQSEFGLARHPAYLQENGKAVLQIWGFGFGDRPGTPEEVLRVQAKLKGDGVLLIGGVPTHWRTLAGDSKSDPSWARVYRNYDVISPWTVGRFKDAIGVDNFFRDVMLPDIAAASQAGVRYMPVVFPGFSWFNLLNNRGQHATIDAIPRECGKFLWRQIGNVMSARVDTFYVAMLDEFDESTAVLPFVSDAGRTPVGAQTLANAGAACAIGNDHYLRLVGQGAASLRRRANYHN
jgi:hypothetical protein